MRAVAGKDAFCVLQEFKFAGRSTAMAQGQQQPLGVGKAGWPSPRLRWIRW